MAARALRAAVIVGRRGSSASTSSGTDSVHSPIAPVLSSSWCDAADCPRPHPPQHQAAMDSHSNGRQAKDRSGSSRGPRKSTPGLGKYPYVDDLSDPSTSSLDLYRRRRSSGASSIGLLFSDSIISPILEEMEDGEEETESPSFLRNDDSPSFRRHSSSDTELLLQPGSRAKSVYHNNYGSIGSDVGAVVGDDDDVGSSGDGVSGSGLPPGGHGKQRRWSARQWQILATMLFATCCSSFAVCLFPPFFPRLAEEKGQSATVYGFVIGTNCLTSFIVTPVLGKSLPKIGVKRAFVVGMVIGGVMCGSSGFLQFFPPDWRFVVTAVFIRFVHATGNAMVIVATFSYSAVEFSDSVGTIFSFTRTAMNLAQLLGPSLGGAIYQCGGFYLPFVAMGAMQTGMGFLMICLLPNISGSQRTEQTRRSSSQPVASDSSTSGRPSKIVTIRNVLRIPTIWFSFLTFIVATMCNGFLSINLEPKVLRHFDLKPFYVGLIFGLKDGANSVSSPIWGYICDRAGKRTVKPYVIVSAILVGASFFLMGAGSFMGVQVDRSMPLLIFALSLNGIGIGGEQVAGVVDALHEAIAAGYPDDPAMHGLIAGLWSSLSGAGRFVSRVGSGILVDNIGFDATAAIVTTLQALMALSMLTYFLLFECGLNGEGSSGPVHWRDVTAIDERRGSQGGRDGGSRDRRTFVFTQSASPSESLMGKTVSIDMPNNREARQPPRAAASLPPPAPRRPAGLEGGEAGYQLLGNSSVQDHHWVDTTRRTSTVGLVARSLMQQDLY